MGKAIVVNLSTGERVEEFDDFFDAISWANEFCDYPFKVYVCYEEDIEINSYGISGE